MSQPARLTSVAVSGFKSFGYPGATIQLGPLDFIVGANGSGKSNLFAALRFLQCAVLYDVEHAVNEFGGVSEVLNRRTRQSKSFKPLSFQFTIECGVKLTLPGANADAPPATLDRFECLVRLDLRGEPGNPPRVLSEDVTAFIRLGNGTAVKSTLRRDGDTLLIDDPIERAVVPEGEVLREKFRIQEPDRSRLAIGIGFFSLPCALLRHLISGWRFFNINPRVARLPARAAAEGELGPGGEGLAVALDRIRKSSGEVLNAILSDLQGIVPGFKGIRSVHLPIESKVAYQVLEHGLPGGLNPDSVSDGTIRLIALMVIAHWTSTQATLITIEEPENGVHPHLAEHIVEILRSASGTCQILATTHDPSFLNYLNERELTLTDKVDGSTRMRSATSLDDIQKFREHFELGDLWMQGVLGATP